MRRNRGGFLAGLALAVVVPAAIMAAVQPKQFQANTRIVATEVNDNFNGLHDRLVTLESRSAVRYTRGAGDKAILANTTTKMDLDTKVVDAEDEFANSRFTAKATGNFIATCSALFVNTGGSGTISVTLFKGGSTTVSSMM